MLGTVPPKVSGVNFVTETLNVSSVPLGLESVIVTDVGWPSVTRPKLAETGSIQLVASAATERFSRPAPCAVGPMSCKPVTASWITRSARFTSADLIYAGDQDGCRFNSTAAEPAMCGVDIEVPLRKAHDEPPQSTKSLLTQELRTLTPTEVTSGFTAKSTAVGPWLLKAARISWLEVVNSWSVASARASGGLATRSAAPSLLLIMTAGKSSPPPPSFDMPIGSPATLLMTTTPVAPAAIALRTFVLNVQTPRLTTATLPEAPESRLVQPLSCVLKNRPNEPAKGGNSPTAASIVVPPLAG